MREAGGGKASLGRSGDHPGRGSWRLNGHVGRAYTPRVVGELIPAADCLQGKVEIGLERKIP